MTTARYPSYDGTSLCYRTLGPAPERVSPTLVCLAGGPGRDAAYLEDLGGLDRDLPLVIPDLRGTGDSQAGADPAGYAFPRLAEDVEALRAHLGLERIALLGHSAAAVTAQAYAARHPERLSHLVLVTPGTRLQDRPTTDAQQIFHSRADEPWYPEAVAALERLATAHELAEIKRLLTRVAPGTYGRWEARQQAHAAAEGEQLHPVPRAAFWQGVDEAVRRGITDALGGLEAPVLVVTGDRDGASGVAAGAVVAGQFHDARRVNLAGCGHYPWVDEPEEFRRTVATFLLGRPAG
ncbi:alpha/beta fold hydrolase [Peterkaempfera bronchialis]|uniref:Alpha/beta hydrolase n=1 Tax=Peterkaempfera bronchialis TaxID=2126346 RepID=A0A345SVK8_9ACTN|nr:alpha/beta hydrolase [Peterkaempfera bronchialis]AXI77763.1 alpha/beta hydrolase [Peterkaempfera bronchialis]